MSQERSDLILIMAPIGRDAELMCAQLRAAGLHCDTCDEVDDLCERIGGEVGAVILTEEALPQEKMHRLATTLSKQPAWSEVPIIVLTGLPSIETRTHSFEILARRTNVTLIDRPVRIKSLISAAQSALRARQRQYEVRDLMRQLEQRIHERDRFLAVLGHELRNPLGAILLASQMADDDGKLDGEHVQLIERQSRHLTQLVNDLLDLSRVAAGKITLKKERVDLREIVEEAVRVAKPAAERQRLDVRLTLQNEPVIVDADPVRVDQIIANVLTNAIKYTPEGGRVNVSLAAEDGVAVIRVDDDGVGIAPERIGGIFELFAQAENAIGRAQGGMGIGLALVRNLVQLHDGTIAAKSDGVGKGAEFTVTLPLAESDDQTLRRVARAEDVASIPAAARRIVIVEDNADVRHLLRLKLKRLGHDVSDAADGNAGLQVLLQEKPDLALVDLGLPGIDGYDLARAVRAELGSNVVLIAVSGFGQPDDKRRALEAGFDEHITKPADVNDIESVLRRFPPRRSAET